MDKKTIVNDLYQVTVILVLAAGYSIITKNDLILNSTPENRL